MTSRLTITAAGTGLLVSGLTFLVYSSVRQQIGTWTGLIDGASALGFASMGIGLLAIRGDTSVGRRLTRAAVIATGAVAVAIMAFVTLEDYALPSQATDQNELSSILPVDGSDLVLALGFLSTTLALGALILKGRRRAGASFAAAAAVAVMTFGFGPLVFWLASADSEIAPLYRILLTAVSFALAGLGLFHAAKAELSRVLAARDGLLLDLKLSITTGAGFGLLVLLGLLVSSIVGREAMHHRYLDSLDELAGILDRFETKLVAAEQTTTHIVEQNNAVIPRQHAQILPPLVATLNQLEPYVASPKHSREIEHLLRLARSEAAHLRTALELHASGQSTNAAHIMAGLNVSDTPAELDRRLSELRIALHLETADRSALHAASRQTIIVVLAAGAVAIAVLLGAVHFLFERQSAARHRSEASLRRHNDTLKSFAHTVAHDLRAPLRGIAGYASELDGHARQMDARGRHCITQINAAAQNLERLIGDTLEYAQLDAETPQLTKIELPTLVASLLQQRAPEIRQHGTQVDTRFGIATVTSWERGLVQIIGNLLDNAIKYSRHAHPPRVRIETAQTPLSWRLVIYDNGIGFDMRYHDRIFGLFQRLVTSEEFEGTGAGLAIVRKITDRLGGSVCAEGRPGGGATFLVELPRVTAKEFT
jgi:signal transduction histidine kinase